MAELGTESYKPQWSCPNCNVLKFDSQNKMVQHAIECKDEDG